MHGHQLQGVHHRRVVPGGAAVGFAGVKELLRRGRVGQGDAQGLGALQGEVQVLLVQLDAEAGGRRYA